MTTQLQAKIEDIDIGIVTDDRKGVIDILNRVLSDQYVLYTKTRNYHWNVTGPLFYPLHKLLEEQYELLARAIDETAERARALGGPALGTLQDFLASTSLKEEPGVYPDAYTMVGNLVADHEAIIRNLRAYVDATDEQFHDMGTSNFLTDQMEQHEKMVWMLRSFLEDRQP